MFHDQHSHNSEGYGQRMEIDPTSSGVEEEEWSGSEDDPPMRFRTAFMVCLCDLLPAYTQQLSAPVRWVWQGVWHVCGRVWHVCWRERCGIDLCKSLISWR